MANDPKSLGPECAVLTSIGTLYLYRLTTSDLRAFREQPGTRLSTDKFRALLTRIASTAVSDKGILDAGSLGADEVESLSDDEIERLAEAYLDSTTLRWYRNEGASATVSVIRNASEPATKFLDRLVNWYAATQAAKPAASDGLSATAPRPRPKMVNPDAVVLSRRDVWIALGALALLGILGIGAFLQHYLLVNSLQRQQEALVAQVKETNAMLAAHAARVTQENADLRRRIDGLEASLRPAPPSSAKLREAKPKAASPATPTRKVKPRRTTHAR